LQEHLNALSTEFENGSWACLKTRYEILPQWVKHHLKNLALLALLGLMILRYFRPATNLLLEFTISDHDPTLDIFDAISDLLLRAFTPACSRIVRRISNTIASPRCFCQLQKGLTSFIYQPPKVCQFSKPMPP